MSRIKLLLDVVNGMRSLADSLEIMANAMSDGDSIPKEKVSAQKGADTPSVTHEQLRELAVKQLIEKYGVKNITAVADADLDAFYADLQQMEVE